MDKVKSRIYKSDGRHYLYIPSSLIKDSAFPFPEESKVTIELKGKTLVVRERLE